MHYARLFGLLATIAVSAVLGCSIKPDRATSAAAADASAKKSGGKSKTSSGKTEPNTKPQIGSLKRAAGGTAPPKGAKSIGEKSKPKVGGKTLPLKGVGVYEFELDYDDDGDDDTLFWAHVDDGSTYIWGETEVECDDGETDGKAGFFMEVSEDGSGGYFFALDECPSGDLYGCDFDKKGKETSCGACSFSSDHIVCVDDEDEEED